MRLCVVSLAFVALCSMVARSQAGIVSLAFEHDRAAQSGSTYLLTMVAERQGQTTKQQKILEILPRATCQARAAATFVEDTLCVDVCLEPGTYSLAVRATQGTLSSDESTPVLTLDLTTTSPCRPITVVPPPVAGQPSQSPPAGSIAVGATIGGAAVYMTEGVRPPSLAELPNMDCVQWKILGPCVCGSPPHPCLTVEYYEPWLLAETVKKPGTSVLGILAPFLDAALSPVAGLLGGGAPSNIRGTARTNLHYNEVHIYTIPQLLGGPCDNCSPRPQLMLNYASELDAASWRADASVASPLDLALQVGTWGRLYARSGKSITGSEPVASGLTAVRGMDIASQPIGLPPNVDTHLVIAPTDAKSRCIQMAWPKQTPCMSAGMFPPLWETASVSPNGAYAWVIWKRRTCCIDTAPT